MERERELRVMARQMRGTAHPGLRMANQKHAGTCGLKALGAKDSWSGVKQSTSKRIEVCLMHELVPECSCQARSCAKDSTDGGLKRVRGQRAAAAAPSKLAQEKRRRNSCAAWPRIDRVAGGAPAAGCTCPRSLTSTRVGEGLVLSKNGRITGLD